MALKLLNGFERVASDNAYSPDGALNTGQILRVPVADITGGPGANDQVPVVVFYALQRDYTLGGGNEDGDLTDAHEKLLGLRIWGKMGAGLENSEVGGNSALPVTMSQIVRDAEDDTELLPKTLTPDGSEVVIAKLTVISVGPLDADVDILRDSVPRTLRAKVAGVDVGAAGGQRFGTGRFAILDASGSVVVGGRGIFPAGTPAQNAPGGYILPSRGNLPNDRASEIARVRPIIRSVGRRPNDAIERPLISDTEGDLVAILGWGDNLDNIVIAAVSLDVLRLAVNNPNLEYGRGRMAVTGLPDGAGQSGTVGGVAFAGAEVVAPPFPTVGFQFGRVGHGSAVLFAEIDINSRPTPANVYKEWSGKSIAAPQSDTLSAFKFGLFGYGFADMLQAGTDFFIGQKKQTRVYESDEAPGRRSRRIQTPACARRRYCARGRCYVALRGGAAERGRNMETNGAEYRRRRRQRNRNESRRIRVFGGARAPARTRGNMPSPLMMCFPPAWTTA